MFTPDTLLALAQARKPYQTIGLLFTDRSGAKMRLTDLESGESHIR